jgi:hypothetical protein
MTKLIYKRKFSIPSQFSELFHILASISFCSEVILAHVEFDVAKPMTYTVQGSKNNFPPQCVKYSPY